MSRVMLAFGSFIVGACCAFAISFGIQTSTWAQFSVVGVPGAIPTISIAFGPSLKGVTIGGDFVQQVDGLNCDQCTFDNAGLIYGGGNFQFAHSTFRKGIRVKLTGAAANTLAFLRLLHALSQPARPVTPPAYKPPLLMQASISTPATVALVTTATK